MEGGGEDGEEEFHPFLFYPEIPLTFSGNFLTCGTGFSLLIMFALRICKGLRTV